MVDEQSTRCFVDNQLLKKLGISAPHLKYSLRTLSGLTTNVDGQAVANLQVRAARHKKWHSLPVTLTSPLIPDTRHERATTEIVQQLRHLAHYAGNFLPEDDVPETLLLIGADCGDLMKSRSVGSVSPVAHITPLGWAVVGPVPRTLVPEQCLARNAHGTHTLRSSVIDTVFEVTPEFLKRHEKWVPKNGVFETKEDDDVETWSEENERFMDILKAGTKIEENGQLSLPLPFKSDEPAMPNNCSAVYQRTSCMLNKLLNSKDKLPKVTKAMQNYIDRKHVELVPAGELTPSSNQANWIPIFSVSRADKDTDRLVFDCSAVYGGTSLNANLYTGPDLNNSLRGVLLRFREQAYAFCIDIEHMYNCFLVQEKFRDFLRFFWWKNNVPGAPVVQYRSVVHLFGASCSPAIAMFCMKVIAAIELQQGNITEAEAQFLVRSFYVDDGLDSFTDEDCAMELINKMRTMLLKYGLKLHKVKSNSDKVRNAFTEAEASKLIVLVPDHTPRALGVSWDVSSDQLVIPLKLPDRPFTRRGVLATTNTLFDPQGLCGPILLEARLLQRDIFSRHPLQSKSDWDAPLPGADEVRWHQWMEQFKAGSSLAIPRTLMPKNAQPTRVELHVFADASQEAIGCVIYLRTLTSTGAYHVVLVSGCSKVAPKAATTIPRLELCAALEAVLHAQGVVRELRIKLDAIHYYSDSNIVLGYLTNTTRSFTRYVTRRVEAIKRIAPAEQWQYIATDVNPADIATRPTSPQQLQESAWFVGPKFLHNPDFACTSTKITGDLPETLPVTSCRVEVTTTAPLITLVERLSIWSLIVRVMQKVVKFARVLRDRVNLRHRSYVPRDPEITAQEAEKLIFRSSQVQAFPEVFDQHGHASQSRLRHLPDEHPLSGVSPFFDPEGLLRVGGRLRNSISQFEVKHPLILSQSSVVTQRYAEHIHRRSAHQGRLITLSQLRLGGVFILKGRALVASLINQCIVCRRLRGATSSQLMADLPPERLEECAPFDHIGIDVFGPYYVHDGVSTRRTSATKKVFVLVVNCLASRAIHLEPLAAMDTVAMINALRRVFAVRGLCKSIRSDHGSNFIGVLGQSLDFQAVQRDAIARGITWSLNPVGASHFGGYYERKIGSVRRILEATLSVRSVALSRDALYTLLQEAAHIVNSTPLYLSDDSPDEPLPVSPLMLLTLKSADAPTTLDSFTERDLLAYGKRRWRRVQYLADHFWALWKRDYIQNLTSKRKCLKVKINLKAGDLVLIRDKNAPRGQWRTGIVSSTVPSLDGLVRHVIVSHVDGHGKRRDTEKAITDLVLLTRPASPE